MLPRGLPDFTSRAVEEYRNPERLCAHFYLSNPQTIAIKNHRCPSQYQRPSACRSRKMTSNWLLQLITWVTFERSVSSLYRQDLMLRNPIWLSDNWVWRNSIIL